MTEASYILVRLLQEFDEIEGRGSATWQENLGLILTDFHGTLVGLKRKCFAQEVGLTAHRRLNVKLMGCEVGLM